MTFVDANYFLRLALKDIPDQSSQVEELIHRGATAEIELCTSIIAFFEVYWVLSSYYNFQGEELTSALWKILEMDFIDLPERNLLREAMVAFNKRRSLKLDDCYNLAYAQAKNAESFATFDQKLQKAFKKSPLVFGPT